MAPKPVPTLTVISHPDPARIGDRAQLRGLARGRAVAISRATPRFSAPGRTYGKPLADPFVSREPIHLKPGKGDAIVLDQGAGKISVSVWGKTKSGDWQFGPSHLQRGQAIVIAQRIVLMLHFSQLEGDVASNLHGLIGHSDSIRALREEIEKVADLKMPVLLRGASGTGKELVARAIHQAARPSRPFVSVNLAALPPTLAAGELFGSVKGSFTGSNRDQRGYFRSAEKGTLFLDEIGETPTEVQVLLLRALETREINPVGSPQTIPFNARLIAATDANLDQMIAQNSFKQPLFHRLAGYELHLPRLSDRLEDFGRLFIHFAKQEMEDLNALHVLQPRNAHQDPWIPPDLMIRLMAFSWPGNVRQLINAVRQLVIGCRGRTCLSAVPNLLKMLKEKNAKLPDHPESETPSRPGRRKPASVKKSELLKALSKHNWNIKAASAELNISRASLYLLIEKTPGFRKAADLTPEEILSGLREHRGDLDCLALEFKVSRRALLRRIAQLGLPLKTLLGKQRD